MSAKPTMISVLRNRDFLLLETNAFFSTLAAEILTAAINWMVYERTANAFYLGAMGLAQFLPVLLLVMFTGTYADKYSRRHIISICMLVEFLAIAGITWVALSHTMAFWPILALLVVLGAGRAFLTPASRALAPTVVKREEISTAISCSTAIWQFCSIAGPAIGGFLYGLDPRLAFGTALAMVAAAAIAPLFIRPIPQQPIAEGSSFDSLLGGFRYMKAEKIVLGATTLDLFAVLFGTIVVLLPIFAHDILIAGPVEFGILRSAIGIGALAMALYLGLYPIRRRAGHIMFAAVGVFGIATVVFGLSHSIILSIAALMVMGASDMVSVYIREVLMQLWTPDQLRGRVNAVNSVLVNASNELGAARAGSMAGLIGPIPAAVMGGICTLIITLLWMRWFPKLRRADDLSGSDIPDHL